MDSNKSRFNNTPPLFEALGIPDVDSSAAELGFCRTIINMHLLKGNSIEKEAVEVLVGIHKDLETYLETNNAR
jgi:hypothetical protein